ncbi:Cof-type HAD-IIB family hydrolase [Leptotrichia sp. OH3620_COT-345]|uniref:Cof-type HAD-IIB family hydrolase n=1 Tax=Leptotrichia sp. OH3620_COT-345 TaxID=2491048 RepID=UPI000F645BC4|nr:Cof-type HAD-IIB family hydrolase [Leptotrichia sp. OH3620_COT-345]RRD39784.1 Cof-type HAD-IIB family hydrolase [Leptotrichia sp. OH3620_COT-345]
MYNVVVSDLDGTLLNSDQEVSEISKKVIRKLMEKGIKFYIATGRAYPDAKNIMKSIGIKIPLISANGAVINNAEGKEVYRNNLDEKYRNIILDIDYLAVSDLIHINIYSQNRWFLTDKERKVNPFEEEPEYMYEVITQEEAKKKDVTKIFYIGPHKDLLKLEKIILDKTNGEVNIAFTHPECLEIFDIGVTKANAIKKLGEIEGFSFEDIVAFGDGFNDYEMLKSVKKGYIMKNAHYTLKAALPKLEIVSSNSRNGVANKLVELYNLKMED